MANVYHDRQRAFSKGNITEENKTGNHKLFHLRLPLDVYYELDIAATQYDVKVGRYATELLRQWAEKRARARAQNITGDE